MLDHTQQAVFRQIATGFPLVERIGVMGQKECTFGVCRGSLQDDRR